ncbi:MAG: FHA domain-containing protein [Candidatus Eremiobacteraeota bacterium]|nr:FHA domain-containing protein [Candidatus Eremiobacteraeota bacterium]
MRDSLEQVSPEFDQHPPQVYYVLVAGEQRIALSHDGTPVRVGRNVDNDIVFADTETSRRHAEFRCRDGLLEVRDMRSMNGTLLEGRRIVPEFWWKVNPNQILQVGINELFFERLPGQGSDSFPVPQDDWLEEADTESVARANFDLAAAQDYDMVLEPPPRLAPPPPPPGNAWLEEPGRPQPAVFEAEPQPDPEPWQEAPSWEPETEDPATQGVELELPEAGPPTAEVDFSKIDEAPPEPPQAEPVKDEPSLSEPPQTEVAEVEPPESEPEAAATPEWHDIPVPETEFIPVPETEFDEATVHDLPSSEPEPEPEAFEEPPPPPSVEEELELEPPVRTSAPATPAETRFKPTMILPDGRLARVDPLGQGRVVVSIAEPLLGSSGSSDLVRLGVDAQGRAVMGQRQEYEAEEFADYLEQQGLAAPRERPTQTEKPLPPGLQLGGEGR